MTTLEKLCAYAHERSINIYHSQLGFFKAMIVNQERISIVIDKKAIQTATEETECLAHELGHYETLTYYTVNTKLECIGQREYFANRWAVMKLLPFPTLREAIISGKTEIWELSEYFELSEDFIHTAIEIYTRRGDLPMEQETLS